MIELGGEYGTVTGRRRRCGWLDLVALRYAARVNSLTRVFITKLDILSAFEEIRVATGYTSSEGFFNEFPTQQSVLYHCEPEYVTMSGWMTDISGVRSYADLPSEARDYVEFIAASVSVPVGWVSVGPERSQLVTVT
jgi:adenylosuccinate synthase